MSEITIEQISEFFEETRQFTQEAKADFDIDKVCRWSYFFGDTDEEKLTKFGSYLESDGYEPIGFIEAEEDDENPELIYLRVDKEELHTVESLDVLNVKLYGLVKEYDIESYEGMDVGPVDEPVE
ncbi:ribonuclease E inhibitor RraB [Parashewanella spongiae]|uniref:Ribonuclease E inhibitor RraB n=1 Tax=Parashewanella spongiae TaxID=342950 RepID=A0A3A6TX57_9GAMM|nr:ribonuclease E inhibitor RraB [Parashewanella spongiae]MCL1080101.1 ribonuclease E inhibitor RraB [Parashewanella spongiae]RJY04932.1 ribonuclease E inhibitor RraB [Parashewanella spongiae]